MAAKRTGLGRGIGALIPTNEQADERPSDVFFPRPVAVEDIQEDLVEVPGARLVHIDPSSIVPNRRNRVTSSWVWTFAFCSDGASWSIAVRRWPSTATSTSPLARP